MQDGFARISWLMDLKKLTILNFLLREMRQQAGYFLFLKKKTILLVSLLFPCLLRLCYLLFQIFINLNLFFLALFLKAIAFPLASLLSALFQNNMILNVETFHDCGNRCSLLKMNFVSGSATNAHFSVRGFTKPHKICRGFWSSYCTSFLMKTFPLNKKSKA